MKLFSPPDRSNSAPVARERLQLLLAHERDATNPPEDLVAVLREEILGVIAKRLRLERHKVLVTMNRGESVSTLEIDLEFPTGSKDRITSKLQPATRVAA
jgi:cell division topological specificity factor